MGRGLVEGMDWCLSRSCPGKRLLLVQVGEGELRAMPKRQETSSSRPVLHKELEPSWRRWRFAQLQ